MKSVAIIFWCALLGWLAKRREHQPSEQQRALQVRANLQRFLTELYADAPKPRVVESAQGVFIRASCEAEAAEIVSVAPQFRARVA